MTDETKTGTSAPGAAGVEPATGTAPDEPFTCPNCGQLLAPACRVCVACREPVDFSKVRAAEPPADLAAALERPAPETAKPRARAQFSWAIFAVSVVAYFMIVAAAERVRAAVHVTPFWAGLVADCALSAIGAVSLYRQGGDRKRALGRGLAFFCISVPCYLAISYGAERLLLAHHLRPLEAGLWIQSAIQVACALWIFFDASVRRVPHRLRWALGSFLIWIIVFPWYLSRRRMPEVHCLIMEAPGRAFAWTVVWLILLYAVLGMILGSMHILPK
ncbi:MAG: hypothetical protein ACRD3D_12955 [Terriglobia bacterium]